MVSLITQIRFAAAFATRFFANELVYADNAASLTAARQGLNVSSTVLRTWHERLLFGSSTQAVATGSIQYEAHGAMPAYRSTPLLQQVRHSFLLICHPIGLTCLACKWRWQLGHLQRVWLVISLQQKDATNCLQAAHPICWQLRLFACSYISVMAA